MRTAWIDPEHHEPMFTDFYYEDVVGDWDRDGDGYMGEYGDDMQQATYDYEAELRVGRIPFDDFETIAAACEAAIRFDQDRSERMLRAMTASQGSFRSSECESALVMRLAEELVLGPAGYSTTSLYSHCPGLRPDFELTMENFLAQWELNQPGFVVWVAHGAKCSTPFMDCGHLPHGVAPAMGAALSCTLCDPGPLNSLGDMLLGEGLCASLLCSTETAHHGADPSPVLMAALDASTSLVRERLAVGDAKAKFIQSFVRNERVPRNMSGIKFHRNIFGLILYGDPSLQLR